MRILVLGVNGMIGSTIFKVLSDNLGWIVFGSLRNKSEVNLLPHALQSNIFTDVDLLDFDFLADIIYKVKPSVIINCAGLTKHRAGSDDPLVSLPINSLFPHKLAKLARLCGARLIHISTDCVFSGVRGNYLEVDTPDAIDVYGRSKALGELNCEGTLTLRTSTIGHELCGSYGLLDWFLSQEGECRGYQNAIFSGFPTVIFAQIIRDVVIPHHELSGLYHVAAQAINKFDLLSLIAETYQKDIEIIRDESFKIDRSLNADRFKLATGYESPTWPELIKIMHAYK
jgi:dTDP-4-dehydrorhamnose reductase